MEAPLHFPSPTSPVPLASSPLTAFGALSLLARLGSPSVLLTALDWFLWSWWLVQTLHQLLHPGLFRVCTQLWLRALPR